MPSAFEIARQRVDELDAIMRDHREAMDCLNCEQYLRLGIAAFRSLEVAFERCIAVAVSGQPVPVGEGHRELVGLCHRWMAPCEPAATWAKSNQDNGFVVEHFAEFLQCWRRAIALCAAYEAESLHEAGDLTDANQQFLANLLVQ